MGFGRSALHRANPTVSLSLSGFLTCTKVNTRWYCWQWLLLGDTVPKEAHEVDALLALS